MDVEPAGHEDWSVFVTLTLQENKMEPKNPFQTISATVTCVARADECPVVRKITLSLKAVKQFAGWDVVGISVAFGGDVVFLFGFEKGKNITVIAYAPLDGGNDRVLQLEFPDAKDVRGAVTFYKGKPSWEVIGSVPHTTGHIDITFVISPNGGDERREVHTKINLASSFMQGLKDLEKTGTGSTISPPPELLAWIQASHRS